MAAQLWKVEVSVTNTMRGNTLIRKGGMSWAGLMVYIGNLPEEMVFRISDIKIKRDNDAEA